MVRRPCQTMLAMDRQTFDNLPDEAVVLRADAATLTGGQHPGTLARWEKLGLFPAGLMVGGQVGYRVGDLRAWLATLKAARVVVVP